MTKRISLVVTYDTGSREFFVDSDTTEVHFPEGLCWDDEAEHWVDEPRLVEDVVQRLADRQLRHRQPRHRHALLGGGLGRDRRPLLGARNK